MSRLSYINGLTFLARNSSSGPKIRPPSSKSLLINFSKESFNQCGGFLTLLYMYKNVAMCPTL